MNHQSKRNSGQDLDRMTEYSEQMIALLKREAALITKRDIESIESISEEKQSLAAQLEKFSDFHLLSSENESSSEVSDDTGFFPDAVSSDSSLARVRSTLVHRLKECRHLNEANGASIELLRRHYQRSLEILHKPAAETRTYGPDGNTSNSNSSRSLTFV